MSCEERVKLMRVKRKEEEKWIVKGWVGGRRDGDCGKERRIKCARVDKLFCESKMQRTMERERCCDGLDRGTPCTGGRPLREVCVCVCVLWERKRKEGELGGSEG